MQELKIISEAISQFLSTTVDILWGIPLVVLLVGSGIIFTFLLKGIQFRGFLHSIKCISGKYDNPNEPGEITHFQALCTALSATVGLGNIAGVAIALHLGGPGATFWMIVTGLVGMVTKYCEVTLAVKFRRVDEKNVVHGGPMHYIELGLGKKWKPLAVFFAIACMISSFGAANMFQTNQVASVLETNFGITPFFTGIVITFLVGIVIIGGIRRIASVTQFLVPFMAIIYVGGSILVIILNLNVIPEIFYKIIHDAFSGTAAFGGLSGIAVKEVIVTGVKRACFSNEAGLGSAPIAHSAVATHEPVREGVVALLEPFIDTVVICTMTALVIHISGAWIENANGVVLTVIAFNKALPGFGQYFIPIAVFLFAYSTLISWSYYGERCADYLGGEKAVLPYRVLFCIAAFIGAIWKLEAVVNFSDIMLALMVVPNLTAVYALFPVIIRETNEYFSKLARGDF